MNTELGQRLAFTRSGIVTAWLVQKLPFCADTSVSILPPPSVIVSVAPEAAPPPGPYIVPAIVQRGAGLPVWQPRQSSPALWCPSPGGVAGWMQLVPPPPPSGCLVPASGPLPGSCSVVGTTHAAA